MDDESFASFGVFLNAARLKWVNTEPRFSALFTGRQPSHHAGVPIENLPCYHDTRWADAPHVPPVQGTHGNIKLLG